MFYISNLEENQKCSSKISISDAYDELLNIAAQLKLSGNECFSRRSESKIKQNQLSTQNDVFHFC